MIRKMISAVSLVGLLSVALGAAGGYTIVNFDKVLGPEKLIYIYPPTGKRWTIHQGSVDLDHPLNATFVLYLEDGPYSPYRNAQGEMVGCLKCVTLKMESTADKTHFKIDGPLVVEWPNRLMIAITPEHGLLGESLPTWTRLQITESDLD